MIEPEYPESPYMESVREHLDCANTLFKEAVAFKNYERAKELFRDLVYPVIFDLYERSLGFYNKVKILSQGWEGESKDITNKFLARQLEIVRGRQKDLLDFDNFVEELIVQAKKDNQEVE